MALGVHITAIGSWSLGIGGAAILILGLLLHKRVGKWWKSPYVTFGAGIAAGFVLIFLIEVCLGVSAVWYGPLYPVERPQTWIGSILLTGLSFVYCLHLQALVDIATILLGALLFSTLELLIGKGKAACGWRGLVGTIVAWFSEYIGKWVVRAGEFLVPMLLVEGRKNLVRHAACL